MIVLSTYACSTDHDPGEVFARWANPLAWPDWDPEVRAIVFSAPMELGRGGKLQPRSGPTLRFVVTEFTPNLRFTTSGLLPGAKLDFVHLVEAGSTNQVSLTVTVRGPLAALWAWLLRRQMAEAARSSVEGLLAHLATKDSMTTPDAAVGGPGQ